MQNQHPRPIHFSDAVKTVLISGATGFVGSLLTRALVEDGHHVIALTRNPKKAATILHGKVRYIHSMDELTDTTHVDVIVNLAGARILGPRWNDRRKQVLRASRIGLTNTLVAWIAQATNKPRLLLSASAVGYYGVQAQGDLTTLTEDAVPQPVFMSQLCQEWEHAACAARAYGVTVACMRFGMVLGRDGALPPMMMPVKLGIGGPLGGGRQTLAWIHVHDLLRGIAHLMVRKDSGDPLAAAYNFTAPHSTTQAEFTATAARILHRPSLFPTPALPVRLLLGEQADIVLEGQRAVPAQLQKEDFRFSYPTADNALHDLLK